jgi:hypothetical protein
VRLYRLYWNDSIKSIKISQILQETSKVIGKITPSFLEKLGSTSAMDARSGFDLFFLQSYNDLAWVAETPCTLCILSQNIS